jgi:putative lipoprotein
MLKKLILLGLVPLAGAVASTVPSQAADAVLGGEVLYRERIALPDNAVVSVELADVSRADAPAAVIGKQEISPAGQVPVKFEIRFDDSAIRPNMTYALQARITVDGELWFINDTHHGVDPLAKEGQTILVKRVTRENDDPLHDTDWNLTFIEGFDGLPERAATLTIGNDGRAHGKGPCNGYFGGVKIDGDRIAIGQIGATQMACEPKRMQAEHAYFQSLGKVAGYKLDGDTLTLSDADGKDLLRFSR